MPGLTDDPERGRVLVADDDSLMRGVLSWVVTDAGYSVCVVSDGNDAVKAFDEQAFDLVISDIDMPGRNGIELLRAIRERDLDIPVVLLTGGARLETAVSAVEYGASHYLTKPVDVPHLRATIRRAMQAGRLARARRQLADFAGDSAMQIADLASLAVHFDSALASAFMAYQPIVCWSTRTTLAYEALVRLTEPMIPNPGALFDAADRLDRIIDIGRHCRPLSAAPVASRTDVQLFVNVHARDLLDDSLYAPDAPLSLIAPRVVLEITERARLEIVPDVSRRITRLRDMGFRVALDDIGAGYAGLNSFAALEPNFVKLDHALVADIDRSTTRVKLVGAMIHACADLGVQVIGEGVETAAERDVLIELGCDLFQGFLFACAGPAFVTPVF